MCFGGGIYHARDSNVESQNYVIIAEERNVRHAFVRKVYLILTFCLLFSFGMVAIFIFVDAVRQWTLQYAWLVWVAIGITLVLTLAMTCCDAPRRVYPYNYICLGIFTICEAFVTSFIALFFAPKLVMIAFGITAAVTIVLTIFAMQTTCDFTGCGVFLLVFAVVVLIFGIVVIFVHIKILHVVYCSLGVILVCFMLVYDTQLMLGGKHKLAIDIDEHVFAALQLFLDIITMFRFILILLGMDN